MKVVYPAVEWRITLNGKVQEDVEDEDKDKNNSSRRVNAPFMLILSIAFLYFYEIL